MRAYQTIGLLAVCCGVAFVAGMKVQERRCVAAGGRPPALDGACCDPLPAAAVQTQEAPAIPSGSGLPCLVHFGSGECDECKKVEAALAELSPRLGGVVDVVGLDPDVYPAEARDRRIRMIPTQILVGPEGEELDRREGAMTAAELVSCLRDAGIDVPPAAGGPVDG